MTSAAAPRTTGVRSSAEGEGWSNQDSCQVTWEFDHEDGQEGSRRVAILDPAGRWISLSLDLSDRARCRAFREGRVA